MKHIGIFAVLAALLLTTSCGLSARTPQEEQQDAALVQQILDSRSYEISIDYMTPLRGPGRSVSGYYSIVIEGDTIQSCLPYFGQARSVPYGGGDGLNFKADIQKYTDKGMKGDRRTIVINVENEGDKLVYTLTVFDNGTTDVRVDCRNRDDISYRGTLRLTESE